MNISEAVPSPILDGFWLPKSISETIINPDTPFGLLSFTNGRPSTPGTEAAVTVRYPLLTHSEWRQLLTELDKNRNRLPEGLELWERLQTALGAASRRLADPDSDIHKLMLSAIPAYTGYSTQMIRLLLQAFELFALEEIPAAISAHPNLHITNAWDSMPGLPGYLYFFSKSSWLSRLARFPWFAKRPIHGAIEKTDLVIGYGAGNIPGAALLVALLTLSAGILVSPPPALIVKNSRREPIFSSLVLQEIEHTDPDLASAMSTMIWDYEDNLVQDILLSSADLVIAAASDNTIAQIQNQLNRLKPARDSHPRFHAHGHKVSFTAIGKEIFTFQNEIEGYPVSLAEMTAFLAALDSIFWDQHGCLSARIHFIEIDPETPHNIDQYATCLDNALRLLAHKLPRGRWPLQQLHDSFDYYKQLEQIGTVNVLSSYNDEFLLVIDRRKADDLRQDCAAFINQINDCQGRVIVVRPVDNLMEIPERYLRCIPVANLQSLSVALGAPGQRPDKQILAFAKACGAAGITAIRTVGRGALPQLAYSWDGLIPPDLVRNRPAGYFTSIEFEYPFDDLISNFKELAKHI